MKGIKICMTLNTLVKVSVFKEFTAKKNNTYLNFEFDIKNNVNRNKYVKVPIAPDPIYNLEYRLSLTRWTPNPLPNRL